MTDYSRFLLCQGIKDPEGRLHLTERVPFPFVVRDDTRLHTVVEGDSLFTLAHYYFEGLPRPSQFYWVIADFQPEPITDATLKLELGRQLAIPSLRTVVQEICNPSRRDEFSA